MRRISFLPPNAANPDFQPHVSHLLQAVVDAASSTIIFMQGTPVAVAYPPQRPLTQSGFMICGDKASLDFTDSGCLMACSVNDVTSWCSVINSILLRQNDHSLWKVYRQLSLFLSFSFYLSIGFDILPQPLSLPLHVLHISLKVIYFPYRSLLLSPVSSICLFNNGSFPRRIIYLVHIYH